ncbi:MAG: DUF4446 family protein [Armatimonadetes bacterium]|nr:DUF4446 family protein [Armatimonadota bacterium]
MSLSAPLGWLPLVVSSLALVLAVLAAVLALRAYRMSTPTPAMRRLQERLAGPGGEQLLAELQSQLVSHGQRLLEVESRTEQLGNQLRGAVQKVGLERFNAHEGLGGNLSFALVMLDARNHGVCLTSIYSLEGCRIFLRGIVSGKTDHPLLPEEQTALDQALRG